MTSTDEANRSPPTHSLLPWICAVNDDDGGFDVFSSDGSHIFHIATDEKPANPSEAYLVCDANASFIVRAVNNHEALITALENLLQSRALIDPEDRDLATQRIVIEAMRGLIAARKE